MEWVLCGGVEREEIVIKINGFWCVNVGNCVG